MMDADKLAEEALDQITNPDGDHAQAVIVALVKRVRDEALGREKVLLQLLSVDAEAPEIILEGDGDLCLTFYRDYDISLAPSGKVAWAILGTEHGSDLERFVELLAIRALKGGK